MSAASSNHIGVIFYLEDLMPCGALVGGAKQEDNNLRIICLDGVLVPRRVYKAKSHGATKSSSCYIKY